jgi:ribulose-bisphosphate carboxylase large chain
MIIKDYVDTSYEPAPEDLIALFRVEPARGFSFEEVIGRVASESSNGTWTEVVTMKPHVRELSAKAYWYKPPWVKIAYPIGLFEPNNMSQILSSIAGNIFGMKAVRYLRLEDVYWPKPIIDVYKGPKYGIDGVRDALKVLDRPILATVPKPKVGLYHDEYAEAAYEIWIGGVDLVKDDENLSSQSYNSFEKRLKLLMRLRDKAEKETGERKSYLVNITAPYREMIRRAKMVSDYGNEFVMIDILTVGWAALQEFRNEDFDLRIHAHRAFHAAFTRNRRHGMSMKLVASISRLLGVDHIHVGTVVGKLESPYHEVHSLILITRNMTNKEMPRLKLLKKEWGGIKPVFPVSSGGLHPGLMPKIYEIFGKDVIIQAGGGVLGHPKGIKEGAKAFRDAIYAVTHGISLDDMAKQSGELREALEYWGYKTYK